MMSSGTPTDHTALLCCAASYIAAKCASYGRNNFGCDLSKGICCTDPYLCNGPKDMTGMVTCKLTPSSPPPKSGVMPVSAPSGRKLRSMV